MDRDELESRLKTIENEMGRIRTADKYAPRTLDLDVVVWNGHIVDEDVRSRNFLKQAVMEVYPDIILP